MISKFFRAQFPRRPDVSGLPYGFWFGWGPKDPPHRYEPTEFRWSFGVYWYAPWKCCQRVTLLPRIHVNGNGPIGC